ncbi:MAG: TIGR00725 family protein [Planctomycetota bacterium]
MRTRIVAVIGAGACDAATAERAHRVGRLLAERGCTVLTGGLGGVMAAASRGAAEAGGLVLGLLPGADPAAANPWVGVAIATGMGDARNAILANTAAAFVAVGGAYGTLSEIAFALQRGKRVVSLGSWAVDPALLPAASPEEAVERALE